MLRFDHIISMDDSEAGSLRGTSGDLSEIWIRCECGQERSMAQVAIQKAEVFGRCDGARPWLGPAMKENCEEMNRLLVRTASGVFPAAYQRYFAAGTK